MERERGEGERMFGEPAHVAHSPAEGFLDLRERDGAGRGECL